MIYQQLELFSLTKDELHILAGICMTESVAHYCLKTKQEQKPIYNLCKRVAPLHEAGKLWKPYIIEWAGLEKKNTNEPHEFHPIDPAIEYELELAIAS